ncbi:ATP-binding protein [Photobacterium sp. 53610]|uniref:ATP-binding protein n=1 Tax=Photobacterium sp. 53610 TaxID=3102789 RepID=UPI002EDA8672
MIKAFSFLWLAIILPLLFLMVPTGFGPISYMSERMMYEFYSKVYDDTLLVIHDDLVNQPQAQWQSYIDDLSEQFGSQLKLVPLAQYEGDEKVLNRFHLGELAMDFSDPTALLKQVADSQWVLFYAMNLSENELIAIQSQGALYILKRTVLTLPQSQWQDYLTKVSVERPFEARLVPTGSAQFSESERRRLLRGQVVGRTQDDGSTLLYTQLNHDYFISIHDMQSQNAQQLLQLSVMSLFVVTISGALLLWLFPLWRDLKRLAKTADDFGEGRLSQRGKISRLSVIAQLGNAFNKMADNIEKLINGHRELTNAIAHDLRTPLYRLRFAFEMLSGSDIRKDQEENYRKIIHKSIDDLDHLINQTLLLSRYSVNSQMVQIAPCHLVQMYQNEVRLLQDEFAGLAVRFWFPPALQTQTFRVDQRAMVRVLNNLLNNAGRFAVSQIRIELRQQDDDWVLIVEDDGPGIPESMRESIFDPFTQVDNQQRDTRQGHGLGLAIVRQIMLLHRGSVSLDEASMGGARFTLRWPMALKPTAEHPPMKESEPESVS